MNATLADLVGRLKSAGRVSAEDVLALRRAFYGAPQIATEDVEALVDLDRAASDRGPEWGEFFAGAVVDYVVHQQEPADYVDGAKANWVMGVFAGGLTVDGSLEALVRIVEAAVGVPSELAAFILGKAKAGIASAGRVDAAGVALLKLPGVRRRRTPATPSASPATRRTPFSTSTTPARPAPTTRPGPIFSPRRSPTR